jgi:CBS domain-containing protein
VNVTISEVMRSPVMTLTPHQSAGHAREVMTRHRVSALPVVTSDGSLVGMVTTSDLVGGHADPTPVGSFAKKDVYRVRPSDGPHVAARIMRNHHLHHVVVVDDERVVGMVSSYDLLRLVEEHRFVMKNAPTPPRREPARR